ncbi:gamma-aminobutyric acid receptor subunit alpha-2 [Parasteatoda tepidariorum]|uniref:gamma-aminobutyric acid receptor subunit alpha-2 n=1 Tax=Parasteatoda tepidariorum TaxID=114398 RepID=UPI001C71B592|nr:gamma-aminobutyric acid receptor subunit alpha-2 [Parasteatoda tepidariorum]
MDYLLHVFVTNIWNDTRLNLEEFKSQKKATILYEGCTNYIWTPDIFYETAKEIKTFEKESTSTLLKVLSDGSIYLSKRYWFRASCPMYLQDYPFDIQKCKFLISLLTSDDVSQLSWVGNENSPYKNAYKSCEMIRQPELLLFHVSKPKAYFMTETLSEGNYTSLIAEFTLIRLLSGSVINTFIPSTMIVIMSFVGFWLQVDAVPARVALCVTSLLTLITQVYQYRQQLPAVNYLKAMDIWFFVCIFMVFSTLVEFAISYNMCFGKSFSCRGKVKSKEVTQIVDNNRNKKESENAKWLVVKNAGSISTSSRPSSQSSSKSEETHLTSARNGFSLTDNYSKFLFPFSFFLFASVYWTYYLSIYNTRLNKL